MLTWSRAQRVAKTANVVGIAIMPAAARPAAVPKRFFSAMPRSM